MTRMTSPTVDDVQRMLSGGPGLWLASGEPQELHPGIGVVLETSGSTGTPQRVMLTREQLVAAARANRDYFGWDATWHLALPSHYVAGLMVLVRGVLSAGVRVCSSDLTDAAPAPGRNCLSIVPTQLIRALDQRLPLDGFNAVLVGGAPLRQDVRARAEDAGVRVVETYGMSETCGGVVYDGVPLPGVEVAIERGLIRLSGPMVTGGSLLTKDRGEWADGRLRVLGRADDIVITGGLKAASPQCGPPSPRSTPTPGCSPSTMTNGGSGSCCSPREAPSISGERACARRSRSTHCRASCASSMSCRELRAASQIAKSS